jgi:AraC-like DNA-binding protein
LLDAESYFPSVVKSAASEINCTKAPENEAEKVAQFIALHYSESHSTEELAKLVHISPSQLRRQFLASYGLPPIAYRGKLRAGIGAVLLLRTKLSVAQIAEQVGYNCVSDFYRIFTRRYGVSPSEYRKENLKPNT